MSAGAPRGVLILAGPTASGKTDLAIALAREFDAEIVGADSRQIYRGMPIGTAAPSAAQLRVVPHHLVGFLDPQESYSAARFASDATRAIIAIHARGKRAIVAGGTGFYVRALTGGVALAPAYDADLRDRLAREARIHDSAFLHEWLGHHDSRRAAMLHPGDRYRVLRALEIALAPAGAVRAEEPSLTLPAASIPFQKVFLEIDASELGARIARRTDAMLANGLVEEAERIGPDAIAANAVGYPQALAYARGWCTTAELRTLLVRATRRYAKRQQAWFRTEPQTQMLSAAAVADAAREKLAWA